MIICKCLRIGVFIIDVYVDFYIFFFVFGVRGYFGFYFGVLINEWDFLFFIDLIEFLGSGNKGLI